MPKRQENALRSPTSKTSKKANKAGLPLRWSLRVMAQKKRERAEAERAAAEMERQRVEAEEERQRAEAEAGAEAENCKIGAGSDEESLLAEVRLESASSVRSEVTVEEETAGMTEYERLRAENIRRNNEILQSLGIDTAKAELERGRGKSVTPRPKNKVPSVPVRRSARVRAREEGDMEETGSPEPDVPVSDEQCMEEVDLPDEEQQPVGHAAVCGSSSSSSIKSEEETLALPLETSLRAWARNVRSKALDARVWSGSSSLAPGWNIVVTKEEECPNAPTSARSVTCFAQGAICSS